MLKFQVLVLLLLLIKVAVCSGSLFHCGIHFGPIRHLPSTVCCKSYDLYFSALKTPLLLPNPLNITDSFIIKWKDYASTANLPREGCPPKVTDRTRRTLIRETQPRRDGAGQIFCRDESFCTKDQFYMDIFRVILKTVLMVRKYTKDIFTLSK